MKMSPKYLAYLFVLQLFILLYSTTAIVAKLASREQFLSRDYVLFYLLMVAILAVYAIGWQQLIKHVDLSVTFANKGIGVFWTMLCANMILGETITWNNIVGGVLVFCGIIVINTREQ